MIGFDRHRKAISRLLHFYQITKRVKMLGIEEKKPTISHDLVGA